MPDLRLAPDARRFEYGNPNFLGIWVQRHSARIIRNVGLDRIEQRVRTLSDRLIDGLDTLRRPRTHAASMGAARRHRQHGFPQNARASSSSAWNKQRIIVSERDGFVRASLYACNNEADIDTFLNAAEALKGS